MNEAIDRHLRAACFPQLSHGACRLYVILSSVAHTAGRDDTFFPVTLAGLRELQPGVNGRRIGATTVLRQIQELRQLGLVEVRSALHRNEPEVPALVRVLTPGNEAPDAVGTVDRQRPVS